MRLIRNGLAVLGALVLLLSISVFVFRKALVEWVVQSAISGSGLHVEPIVFHAAGLGGVTTGPVKLNWQDQQVTIQAIHVPIRSVLPPRLGVVEVSGTEVTLRPELLRLPAQAPVANGTAPDQDITRLIAALEGVKADVRVRLGNEPTAVLDTTLEVRTAIQGIAGSLSAKGNGLESKVPLAWDVSTSQLSFGPAKASVDLAKAMAMVRSWLPGELADFDAQGVVDLDLEGTAGKNPLFVKGSSTLRGGSVRLTDLNLQVIGIDAAIQWLSLLDVKTEEAQSIRVARAEVGKVAFENTALAFTLLGPNEFQLNFLETHGFGGVIRFSSTKGTISPLDATLELSVENVDIAELSKILPPMAATATGRIDGNIQFARRNDRWYLLGGQLALRKDAAATIRVNMPGLITGGMPPKGVTYDILRKVETGLLNLQMDSLEAKFSPATSENEVAALITITGQPISKDLRAPVSFDVTVRGDVTRLISFGLRDDLSISTKP